MKFDFITIGGITEDIVFFTDQGLLIQNKENILMQKILGFEYGSKINIKEYGHYFGGGALNTAVNFSNLGFKSSCVSRVGKDERSSRFLKVLKNKKIDSKNIEFDRKHDSGFSFILNNKKDRIIFTYRGANDYLDLGKKDLSFLSHSRWVYLSSLPSNCSESLKNIFKNKNKIAWNPGIQQLSKGISGISGFLKKTDILILNKDEALELIKKTKHLENIKDSFLINSKNLIKLLKTESLSNIIILTDGENGAYFFDGNNFYYQKIIKNSKKIDSTGVGDTFASTFVAFFERLNGDYKKSMFLAVKNASSVVSMPGAQNGLLNLKDLLKS